MMPTLGRGPEDVLNDLGVEVGSKVSSNGGIRGVYKILEIRKPTCKPATIVLELVAKMISMEELWEMIIVTVEKDSKEAVSSAENVADVEKLTLEGICEAAATNISASRPPTGSKPGDAQSSPAATTGDAGAAVTTGVAAAVQPAAEIDFSFKDSLELTIDVFTTSWSLAPGSKVKYSLDENWPEANLIRNPRNAASALQGAVHMALWKLGMACAGGIMAEKFIQSVSGPTKQLFAYPGPAVENANRD